MERHNLLHDDAGKVVGVVDMDAIMGGDILFEYGHLMMNFTFTDTAYKDSHADHYIEALKNAEVVAAEDISLLPSIIRAFAAEDLLYYLQNDSLRRTDLCQLAEIYQLGVQRSTDYFANLSLAAPIRKYDRQTGLHEVKNNLGSQNRL
jgi:hypothetical protein